MALVRFGEGGRIGRDVVCNRISTYFEVLSTVFLAVVWVLKLTIYLTELNEILIAELLLVP